MCNAVSTSEWQVQKARDNSSRRWREEGRRRQRLESHTERCDGDASSMQRVARIKSNSFWCTLDISSSCSISRLSSVSDRLSYCYQQCVRVCVCVCVCSCVCERVLLSDFSPFLYLLFVGFFAPSVLLENLLFFYCCESGWYLIC